MSQDRSRLRVVRADITRLRVEAIVNAANEAMLGGSGVDGAIHRAGGPKLLAACRDVPEVRPGVRCPTGEARITPGFDLPAAWVIHTVGPVWRGGDSGEPERLASCYRSTLALAAEHGIATIAFPAISCGVYGYPIPRACRVAVNEVRRFLMANEFPEQVLLVAFSATMENAYREALSQDPNQPDL